MLLRKIFSSKILEFSLMVLPFFNIFIHLHFVDFNYFDYKHCSVMYITRFMILFN